MGHEAGADDQHALVAQRRAAGAPSSSSWRGSCGGQAQLQHRDVGVGVHDLQRHPGAVVEAAAAGAGAPARCRASAGDLRGQVAGVRGVVAHRVVQRGEAAEVVDQLASGRVLLTDQRRGLPVRADDEDRLRLGQRPRPAVQLAHPVGPRTAAGRRGSGRGWAAAPSSGVQIRCGAGCSIAAARRRCAANGCAAGMRASASAVLSGRASVMRSSWVTGPVMVTVGEGP